jgi:site-specific recombinase XerD
LDAYQGVLTGLIETLGEDPREYSASRLRAFVQERARSHSVARAKGIVVAVRALVRFLGATGRCEPGMEHALPGFASREVFSLPRFLPAQDVERVIESSQAGACGVRDHAIVLLLARLGLRAGEVARLRLSDIDWRHGRLAVCGKGRREEWLPLPQEVGAAVLRYLQEARPPVRLPEVFTTRAAPWRAVSRQAVTIIAHRAILRAGVRGATNGAHVLRHSVATTMLRQGASLSSISAVLRHRSLRTTTHYAKVDFALLAEIAQPWPGRVPC